MRYAEIAANAFNAVSILLAARNSLHTWWTGIVGCALFVGAQELRLTQPSGRGALQLEHMGIPPHHVMLAGRGQMLPRGHGVFGHPLHLARPHAHRILAEGRTARPRPHRLLRAFPRWIERRREDCARRQGN